MKRAAMLLLVLSTVAVGQYCVESDMDWKSSRSTAMVMNDKSTEITASTEPQPGENRTIDIGRGVKLDLVWVPKGSFMMGSPSSEKLGSLGFVANALPYPLCECWQLSACKGVFDWIQ